MGSNFSVANCDLVYVVSSASIMRKFGNFIIHRGRGKKTSPLITISRQMSLEIMRIFEGFWCLLMKKYGSIIKRSDYQWNCQKMRRLRRPQWLTRIFWQVAALNGLHNLIRDFSKKFETCIRQIGNRWNKTVRALKFSYAENFNERTEKI